jgi:hypothetical protein
MSPSGDRNPGSVGILAYGSLIDEPGPEIAAVETGRISQGVTTPFNVEFARLSRTRKEAPTLIPVESGGSPVRATIVVVKASAAEAANMLWRRETGHAGQTEPIYVRPASPSRNSVLIEELADFHGVATVLYTRIGTNLTDRSPASLARFAINSARALRDRRDGISYLIAAKRNGIRTPLSPAYEDEIKRQTEASSLEEALMKIGQAGG